MPQTEKYTLIAFLSCLGAIVILVLAGAYLSVQQRPVEALGIGGAVTGLIGVLGTFKPRSAVDANVTNTKDNPANVQEAPKGDDQ